MKRGRSGTWKSCESHFPQESRGITPAAINCEEEGGVPKNSPRRECDPAGCDVSNSSVIVAVGAMALPRERWHKPCVGWSSGSGRPSFHIAFSLPWSNPDIPSAEQGRRSPLTAVGSARPESRTRPGFSSSDLLDAGMPVPGWQRLP